ncbi:MAG: acetyl-CoA decarbonylase/synthase complex subunit alpha/beta [Candidatus Omnitrophica bacterium]|nr:acetyl-CoA decarbonylase/synthase complex subunit alpha/beta [Candidatus Omnitrophota bacterium]
MLKVVGELAVNGARKAVGLAEGLIDDLIKNKGEGFNIGFPGTAFYLPLIYATLGNEVKTLKDAKAIIGVAKTLLKNVPEEDNWDSLLSDAMDSGVATALAAELIEALRYATGELPKDGWQGFIPDSVLRSLGIQLVDGRIGGVAVIVGAAPDNKTAVSIIRELQEKNILSLLAGSADGKNFRDQIIEEGVQVGLDYYIVPLGLETTSVIHAANFAIRASLSFGGNKKGELEKNIKYCKERVPAFIVALGGLDDIKVAAACAAIRLGLPVITDQKVPEIKQTPFTLHEALLSVRDHSQIIPAAFLAKEIKIKVKKIPIPVPYSAAFEGERVRREQMYVQFGGKFSTAFEFVTSRPVDQVEDGKIEVVGPEIKDMQEGGAYPLGIRVEVAGRKMKCDFEPIIERQIHSFLNEAMGIFHMGQRNMCWLRISKEAHAKGFNIRHFGVILHARIHDIFGSIVDKVRVAIYTNEKDVRRLLPEAEKAYGERDERMAGMTDESVETFYSCTLCQSFAPNHLCIIKPERLGLCGAYSWLDAQAAHELNPHGGNQPVKKGEPIDKEKGEWKGVNDFVYQSSNKTLERFHGYSIMTYPETSCGCFECIVAIVPEANGFMVVNREYAGMTPVGMGFSTLAGSVGGGQQTPGFMGVGRLYLVSKKFISADGGLKRIVWMPRELKEALMDKLKQRAEESGEPDLIEKIADETTATSSEELLAHLEKVKHPALSMPPLM